MDRLIDRVGYQGVDERGRMYMCVCETYAETK